MRLRQILDDDSAVSPVIGVILMVAITVILAAVIASFVLGLGPSEAAPTAQFQFDDGPSGSATNVTIAHQSGDKIEAQYLYVRGDVGGIWNVTNGSTDSYSEVNWANETSSDTLGTDYADTDEIASGDELTVVASKTDWSLSLVWEKDDQSSELASQSA